MQATDGDLDPDTEARLAEIRKRANAAASGPWHWAGNTDVRHVYLANWQPGRGRCSVMDFARWGMNSAKPQFVTDHLYVDDINSLAVYEVAPSATSRDDKRVYRADIIGLRHPDAEFIAHSRADVDFLLGAVDHLRHVIDALKAERAQDAPTTWTGDDGTAYDLAVKYTDRFEQVWQCTGWHQGLGTTSRLPQMVGDFGDHLEYLSIRDALACYGPLTRADDSELVAP